jgi:hypothetical protein
MFRAGMAAVLALAAVPAVAASRCGPATVEVTVLDQGGSSLGGLAPSDFKIRIKGQSANVNALNYGVFPHSTLLLVEKSGTMAQPVKNDLARQLAQAVVASAPGAVMVGSYGNEVSTLADARSGPGFTAALQNSSDDRSAVYDALIAGMTSMKLHSGDAVVVVTDAGDNGSKLPGSDVQQRLAATGARLFIIALPPASGSGSMQPLSDLALASGGAVLAPLPIDGSNIAPAQIDGALVTLNRSYGQYSNVYQLETDVEGQDRALPLRVEVDRRKLGGGRIVAPAVLAPCTAIAQ